MAEQLTIFGLWEEVAPQPIDPAPPPPPPEEPTPVDPRQVDLLSGPQTLRAALIAACEALDATAVRRAHASLVRKFVGQRWAARAPAWADGVEWLVGTASAPIDADTQVERALSLRSDETAGVRFPEATAYLLGSVRTAALRRCAERLTSERGASARMIDNRPAGYLLLLAGDASGALRFLTAAREADAAPNARLHGYLGEAYFRSGDDAGSLRAYVRACLLDADAIDEEMLTCRPVIDLIEEAEDRELPEPSVRYVPVLADLLGRLHLDDTALDLKADASPARRLAALLRAYRKRRAGPDFDEAARIEAKRKMLPDAPKGLKELLRAL